MPPLCVYLSVPELWSRRTWQSGPEWRERQREPSSATPHPLSWGSPHAGDPVVPSPVRSDRGQSRLLKQVKRTIFASTDKVQSERNSHLTHHQITTINVIVQSTNVCIMYESMLNELLAANIKVMLGQNPCGISGDDTNIRKWENFHIWYIS